MNFICRVFGHAFMPRYDKSAPVLPQNAKFSASDSALEAMRSVTYRGDICTRCGSAANSQQVKP